MKTILAAAGLVAVLVLPTGAVAKPDENDKAAAKAECKAERGKTAATREAFRTKYRGFADCVKGTAEEEEAEGETALRNAAKECKAERAADQDAFAEKYGTNANKKNAFGKCVSQKAKAKRQEQDQEDAAAAEATNNAAQECDAERSADRKAFDDKYGTNHNKKNVFGKCVSQKSSDEDNGEGDGGS